MPDPVPAPVPEPLHCAFCGAAWDNGLFFTATIYARPVSQKRVNMLACRVCQVASTDAQLQQQFDTAVGQEQGGPARVPRPEVLCCAFCGRPWAGGLFFGAVVYAREPGQNKVPVIACHLCHATRSDAELQCQFDAAIGQTAPDPAENPES